MAAWSPSRLAAVLIVVLVIASVQPAAAQVQPDQLLVPFKVEVVSRTLLPLQGEAYASPDGSKLLFVSDVNRYIAVYSMEEGLLWHKKPGSLIGAPEDRHVYVEGATWLDDRRILLLASISGGEDRLAVIDASTGSQLWSYAGDLKGFKVSPGGSYVVVDVGWRRLVAIDASTGSELGALLEAKDIVIGGLLGRAAWLSSDEVVVVSYSKERSPNGTLYKANVELYKISGGIEPVSGFSIDLEPPRGRYSLEHVALDAGPGVVALAVSFWPGKALVYSIDGSKLGEAEVDGKIVELAVSPSGDRLAVLHEAETGDGETAARLTVFSINGGVEEEWSGELAKWKGIGLPSYTLSWDQQGSYIAVAVKEIKEKTVKIISTNGWSVEEPLHLATADTSLKSLSLDKRGNAYITVELTGKRVLIYRYNTATRSLETIYVGTPSLHPLPGQGSLVAFYKAFGKIHAAWLSTTGKVTRVTEIEAEGNPAISKIFQEPGGSRFLIELEEDTGDTTKYTYILLGGDGVVEASITVETAPAATLLRKVFWLDDSALVILPKDRGVGRTLILVLLKPGGEAEKAELDLSTGDEDLIGSLAYASPGGIAIHALYKGGPDRLFIIDPSTLETNAVIERSFIFSIDINDQGEIAVLEDDGGYIAVTVYNSHGEKLWSDKVFEHIDRLGDNTVLTWSPNGDKLLLATDARPLYSMGYYFLAKLYTKTGELVAEREYKAKGFYGGTALWSPDGETIIVMRKIGDGITIEGTSPETLETLWSTMLEDTIQIEDVSAKWITSGGLDVLALAPYGNGTLLLLSEWGTKPVMLDKQILRGTLKIPSPGYLAQTQIILKEIAEQTLYKLIIQQDLAPLIIHTTPGTTVKIQGNGVEASIKAGPTGYATIYLKPGEYTLKAGKTEATATPKQGTPTLVDLTSSQAPPTETPTSTQTRTTTQATSTETQTGEQTRTDTTGATTTPTTQSTGTASPTGKTGEASTSSTEAPARAPATSETMPGEAGSQGTSAKLLIAGVAIVVILALLVLVAKRS